MIGGHTLARLFRGLEALYQTDSGLDPRDLVRMLDGAVDGSVDGAQELLLLRESDGELEIALLLDRALLRKLQPGALLDDARLGEALPILEGLSHLCYLAEAARRERPVSGLELETQAEVDKLALTLLARWPTAHEDFDAIVERLYRRFSLLPMTESLAERYQTANRLALSFSRRLRPHVRARRLPALREALREFWHSPMANKHALAS